VDVAQADISGINTNPFKGIERFRLPASYFSLLVQRKVTKRKHLPRQIAQGVWVAKEFSDSASCLDPKTAAIHGRRPSGVSGCWRLLRDQESQRQRAISASPHRI
jgi:hypothetical protein